MEKKKLIMFDFDGVLVDTLMACYDISAEVNESLSLEEYKGFLEGNIFSALRSNGAPRVKNPNFFEQYRSATRELIIPDELIEMTKRLAEKYVLTIVSSTHSELIGNIVNRHVLQNCFADILGSDVHTSKVIKIKSLLEKYSVGPKKTIFITDTVGDIRESRECGVSSIAVSWGFHAKEKLLKAEPYDVVDTVPELADAIERFFSGSAIQ